jgi:hypothetical protein
MLRLHHPPLDYRAGEDYAEEDMRPYELSNLVFFTPSGWLGSHGYNDHAGGRIIGQLREGDEVTLQKYPDRLDLTVREVRHTEGKPPKVAFQENLPGDVLGDNRTRWVIVGWPDHVQ